jgi:hypothetical protein
MQAGVVKIDDEKPWLKRKDWTDGQIISSSRKAVLLLWIFLAFWCGVSAIISLAVVPQQLHQGNRSALIVLIFPVIGLAMIFFALNMTLAWRKFGRSIFAMATFPAVPGGALQGRIQVKTKLQPQHGWHLRLSCVRRTTTGASNNRHTSEKILWQDEKWLRADLPQTDADATDLPVYFILPDYLPESAILSGDGIHWKLEASAQLRGPDFHAAFDLPVFKLQEAPISSDDPTAQYQVSLDEIRQQIHSHIRVNNLPDGGSEFIFPAARNPGFASGATIVWLVWTGIVTILFWKHAPLLFVFVFGAIDLLMSVYVFDLWFRSSRVVADPKGVTAQKAWFALKKEQQLPISEIKIVSSDIGATVGHAVYHDLKIQTRDGKELILAKNLNCKPEADWVVQQMIAALKCPA